MQTLLVGGVFDPNGGRPSGYITKLGNALQQHLPEMRVINGGTYEDLKVIAANLQDGQNLLWFADVSNALPKLLADIMQLYPRTVLVQSKNNRLGKYYRTELWDRMHKSGAELLVEFTDDDSGKLAASVHTVARLSKLWACTDIDVLAKCLLDELTRISNLLTPLEGYIKHIPVGQHVGAFGVERKHHIHEGIDIYGEDGEHVYAIEDGTIVGIYPFTGESVGSPWWHNTWCVMIEGASGVINYGELQTYKGYSKVLVGQTVIAGQGIGKLHTVLKKDKGRPMTMLHLERYVSGTTAPIKEWTLGTPQPEELINPTTLLKY